MSSECVRIGEELKILKDAFNGIKLSEVHTLQLHFNQLSSLQDLPIFENLQTLTVTGTCFNI